MGVHIEVRLENLKFKVKDEKKVLAAINALHNPVVKKTIEDSSGSHYSWVNEPEEEGFKDLITALHAWRYEAKKGKKFIEVVAFRGEKLGDDKILFKAIAPFVVPGGVIDIEVDEFDARYVYAFSGGKVNEKTYRLRTEEDLVKEGDL